MKNKLISGVTAFSGIVILFFLFRYRTISVFADESFQINSLLALLWLPWMIILLVFRSDLDDFGISASDLGKTMRISLILSLITVIALIPISQMASIRQHYPINHAIPKGVLPFLHFAAVYGLNVFGWEFFFRGYLLFGLQKTIGWGAVFVQAAASAALFYGKPGYRALVPALFLIGIFLGWVTLRSKSILPSYMLHWISGIALNAMVLGYKQFIQ